MRILEKPGKMELNKQKKHRALLDSAYELFTTIGFDKTTITKISFRAGVGKGTFYLYFKDKKDIQDELILLKSTEIINDAIEALSEVSPTPSFTEKIIFVTDYVINTLSKDIAKLQFISKNLSWGLFMDSYQYNGKATNNDKKNCAIREVIYNAIKSDGINPEHMEIVLFTIIELVNSTCYNVILNGEPATLGEYKVYLYRYIKLIIDDALK